QQLEFRCVRSTNNETRVERNRLQVRQHYALIVKILERIVRGFCILFFFAKYLVGFIVFSFTFGHKIPYP
ncbi:hypothetical protein, partial [Flavobacterium psychrotolerans]|uniref:hypothetical protein n=1 Tax=Flavobacterium psychrotolerans TaxID=2169410 RepID=UPI001AA090C4